jgi:glycerophosphoryl diester phosphodiesterase
MPAPATPASATPPAPTPPAPTPPAPRPAATVVAHRANSIGPSPGGDGPRENSLAAIAAAGAAGADAVELDVRRTWDARTVLAHDPFQWQRWRRVQLPLPVRWSRRRWLSGLPDLDAALDAALGAGLDVKLDVKDASIAGVVRRQCHNRGLDPARLALWCRSPAQVADPANHEVFGEVALLADGQDAETYLRDATSSRATAVSLNPDLLSASAVSAAREHGFTVYAWIVAPDQLGDALDLGVNGVVTDWVAQARDAQR